MMKCHVYYKGKLYLNIWATCTVYDEQLLEA